MKPILGLVIVTFIGMTGLILLVLQLFFGLFLCLFRLAYQLFDSPIDDLDRMGDKVTAWCTR